MLQDFGRVQALVAVFSRIVDVDKFRDVVLSTLREEERRELQHRLGILNVLNPVSVSSAHMYTYPNPAPFFTELLDICNSLSLVRESSAQRVVTYRG